MSDRRERIPAAEVPDPKLWKLPFWTEPKHLVQAEEVEEDDSDVLIEDEEIEIEPLTAEQLECIRQEAYNEGLEQGLVEGRQKGEKQGFESGQIEGMAEGKEAGQKLGYEEGYQSGEKAAIADGENKSAELKSKIHSNLRNLDKAISEQTASIEAILPDLVLSIAQAVVSEELDQGSEHIVNIVQLALNALPTDSKGLTIECNPIDLPFFESSQEQTEFEGKFKVNSRIQPGGCKVHSRYSSIDFTLGERWKAVVKQYQQQLKMGISNINEIQSDQQENDTIEESNQSEEIDTQSDDLVALTGSEEIEKEIEQENQESELESTELESTEIEISELETDGLNDTQDTPAENEPLDANEDLEILQAETEIDSADQTSIDSDMEEIETPEETNQVITQDLDPDIEKINYQDEAIEKTESNVNQDQNIGESESTELNIDQDQKLHSETATDTESELNESELNESELNESELNESLASKPSSVDENNTDVEGLDPEELAAEELKTEELNDEHEALNISEDVKSVVPPEDKESISESSEIDELQQAESGFDSFVSDEDEEASDQSSSDLKDTLKNDGDLNE